MFFITKLYPHTSTKKSNKKYNVIVGIGGNIGDIVRRFNHLFFYLQKSKFVDIVETAPILKNPPFGYLNQDDFYNSIIVLKTNLQPKPFLRYILHCENRFGRKRPFKNAPRTLDIDIIFYENRKMRDEKLTLPHPHWHERDSVLIPLDRLRSVGWIKKFW